MTYYKSIVCVLCICFWANAHAASISAQVNTRQAGLDDTIFLVIRIDDTQAIDANAISGFEQLNKQFAIVSRSTGQSQNIINGRATYGLEMQLELAPKENSQAVVPSFTYRQAHTTPITITLVNTPSSRNHLPYRIEVETLVDEEEVFVGQPIHYYSRVKTNVELRRATFDELTFPDSFIKPLPQTNQIINAPEWRYRAYTLPYRIFPTQAGELVIPARQFSARIVLRNNSSLFNQAKHIRRKGDAQVVKVRPAPEIYFDANGNAKRLKYWLPADSLTVTERWQNHDQVQQGDIISRSVQVKIRNSIALQVPEQLLPQVQPAGITTYPKKPLKTEIDKQGLQVTWAQQIDYLIDQAGALSIPAMEIVWWNNQQQRFVITRLPAKHLSVRAASGQQIKDTVSSTDVPKAQLPSQAAATSHLQPVSIWSMVINALYLSAIVVVVVLLVLLGYFGYRMLRLRYQKYTANQRLQRAERAQLLAVLHGDNDSRYTRMQQLRTLLLRWSRHHWQTKDTNLENWRRSVLRHVHGVSSEQLAAFIAMMNGLHQRDTQADIQPQHFSALITKIVDAPAVKNRRFTRPKPDPLPALYPE